MRWQARILVPADRGPQVLPLASPGSPRAAPAQNRALGTRTREAPAALDRQVFTELEQLRALAGRARVPRGHGPVPQPRPCRCSIVSLWAHTQLLFTVAHEQPLFEACPFLTPAMCPFHEPQLLIDLCVRTRGEWGGDSSPAG